ncbi:VOC family protein [Streptomyces sp. WAC05374]|nr:VOC family protein [Streptomyces sp. WAC05374]TDF50878.1 VOC family protein [Streptomyces sp. WAC05374]TDF51891.1 VOC family protein [Streptomyces sp. WAC05374]TDF61130.1 VOC family protein [Streptomyces sp. WAC05374]
MPGVPGVTAVHHVAYTVPDLDEAVGFLTRALGAELAYRTGPIADPGGRWMARQLGVHPDAVAHIAMLRLGAVTNIELFEYTAPDQRRTHPRNSDWGGHHLALWTDDFDASLRHLTAHHGVRPLGEPQTVGEGPIAGTRFIYLATPLGLHIELVQSPARLPYHDTTAVRLFDPSGGTP